MSTKTHTQNTPYNLPLNFRFLSVNSVPNRVPVQKRTHTLKSACTPSRARAHPHECTHTLTSARTPSRARGAKGDLRVLEFPLLSVRSMSVYTTSVKSPTLGRKRRGTATTHSLFVYFSLNSTYIYIYKSINTVIYMYRRGLYIAAIAAPLLFVHRQHDVSIFRPTPLHRLCTVCVFACSTSGPSSSPCSKCQ